MTDKQIDPRAAIDAAVDAARLSNPVIDANDRQFALVPNGYALADISDPLRMPVRPRQVVTIDDRASMTNFVNRFSDERSILVADFNALTVSACLDFHKATENGGEPGASDFRALFKLLPSEEFKRWDGVEGRMHAQAEFAEFLDENASDICDPDPATMVEISRELEATIGAVFKSKVAPESGDRAFQYETETKTKGDVIVPKKFSLLIPVYNGEQPEVLSARFRFRPTGDGLQLGFVWHRVEYQRRAVFTAIATQIAEDTGRPVFSGRTDGPAPVPPTLR